MSCIQAEIIYNKKNLMQIILSDFKSRPHYKYSLVISTNQLVTSTTFKYVSSSPTVNLHKTMK